jgi:hypothetical protein
LLFLLNGVFSEEATNINFIAFGFDPTGARTHDLPLSRRAG